MDAVSGVVGVVGGGGKFRRIIVGGGGKFRRVVVNRRLCHLARLACL
jgi:hypothetical protein